MSDNDCKICGDEIRIMINRGSGICSETCRKEKAKQKHSHNQSLIEKAEK